MRWFGLVGLSLLAACGASEVQSQKLKDGSWSFTCELSMDECVRRVQEQCPYQRYRILEATSETRLRDAPPFEHAYHTSRVHLACNDDGANVLLSVGSGSESTAPKSPAVACSIGETRSCIGPGACQGGQACLPDRKGFGACDCGPAPSVKSLPTPNDSAAPVAPDAASPPAL